MNGGQDEINDIRKLLEGIIERNFATIAIPAAWLMLSLCLRKTGVRTMSLAKCEEIAGKLGISPKELQDALWFLHHYIGTLLYYPEIESLKDTVICDIQVVFDSASNLIKNTFSFNKVGHKISQQFKEKAQFSLQDIKKAASCHADDLVPLEKLVALLKDRNVLAEMSTSESIEAKAEPHGTTGARKVTYFMPCVLISATSDELIASIDSHNRDPPPLLLRYNCGYFPTGVFPAMIANLVSQQREDWQMITEGIRKNMVQFHVGDNYDTVTLISHPRFLEIVVSRQARFQTPAESLCDFVLDVVQNTLDVVTSHLNYHFRMQYKLGFECSLHPGKPREHICVLAKPTSKLMECLQNPKKKQLVPLESHHKVWFSGTASSPATVSANSGNKK